MTAIELIFTAVHLFAVMVIGYRWAESTLLSLCPLDISSAIDESCIIGELFGNAKNLIGAAESTNAISAPANF